MLQDYYVLDFTWILRVVMRLRYKIPTLLARGGVTPPVW
jgi:hypothetical protein